MSGGWLLLAFSSATSKSWLKLCCIKVGAFGRKRYDRS